MLDWDDVQFFLAVHRAGTLLGAARALKVEHSTVGRRLSSMETTLGAKLFARTPDGYQLTPLGASVVGHAERAESSLLQIERIALADGDRAEGTVTVTTSESFASILAGWIAELRGKHPRITVELLVGNQQLDLSRREADLAVRFSPTTEGSLVCRRIGRISWAAYASQAYVAARGGLDPSGSLTGHDVIAFHESLTGSPGGRWLTGHADGATVVLRTASIPAACNAAAAGLGVAVLPCFVAAAQPGLVPLTAVVGARDAYLVVHPDLARVARIRVVMAFFMEAFVAGAPLLEGGPVAGALPPALPAPTAPSTAGARRSPRRAGTGARRG